MRATPLVVLTTCLIASAAFAHKGVKNPAVIERMKGMSAIGANMKVLGNMAKGQTAFDAGAAQQAAALVAKHASQAPALFKAQETDPKSEALPKIWDNFGDFTSKAKALEAAATKASVNITTAADLGSALESMGGTCAACHKAYRE